MGNRAPACGKACSNCAADCARPGQGLTDDLEDDRPGGDPAGATFEETLEDLNSLDRNLMLFCATSNLAAVRWLLHLGAHWEVCDTNGTSCLHVACRAGVLSVVKELTQHERLLEATDVAGWTALHIAVLMGRSAVVMHLLQAGASPFVKNSKGQVPAELCADNITFEVLQSYMTHQERTQDKPWHFHKDISSHEDAATARLQYEPFFVPRQPLVRLPHFKKELQKLGVAILDAQPGFGLAFLVATGVVRDYPVDLSAFLRRSRVNSTQVGKFLGEAFSLSHTIRLEYINSVSLANTGIVSAMVRVFQTVQLPDDLQKINRLVHAVARIWWRQQEKVVKEQSAADRAQNDDAGLTLLSEELVGHDLRQYISSADVLHQTMFSTVLLHWYMHREGNGFRRMMDFNVWRQLNKGIEAGGADVPEHVLQRIHSLVSAGFIREIAVSTPSGSATRNSSRRPSAGGPDAGAGPGEDQHSELSHMPWSSIMAALRPVSSLPHLEGWVQFVGGGFPHVTNPADTPMVSYKSISSIFSEVTDYSGLMKSPLGTQADKKLPGRISRENAPTGRKEDWAWIAGSAGLLFFAAEPHAGAPYAFTELRKLALHGVRPQTRAVTIVGYAELDSRSALNTEPSIAEHTQPANTPPINVVLLLPDGRWQELSLGKLELRVPKVSDLETWVQHFDRSGSSSTRANPSPTSDPDARP